MLSEKVAKAIIDFESAVQAYESTIGSHFSAEHREKLRNERRNTRAALIEAIEEEVRKQSKGVR